MKKFSLCLVALLTFSFASQLLAITDEEIFRTFSLNLSTPGARARAMGGAFIGRADDATAAETNPAGLSLLVRPEIAAEYGFSNSRSVATNIVQIPVKNYDITPSPVLNPDPGGDLDEVVAEFHSNDTLQMVSQLGFLSLVYPVSGVTFAVSRHELINSDASVSGSLSSSPFHFVEANSFEGRVKIDQVNYGFSAAVKAGDKFCLGATVKIADFSFQSQIGAKQKDQLSFGDHFTTNTTSNETKVGFNAGLLIRPTPKVSFGAVYRYEPKFTLDAVVDNVDFKPNPLIVSRQGSNQVNFDVPDTLGVGVSLSPTPHLNLDLDVLEIFYSQMEHIDTGFSLFTHLLPIIDNANQISFKINDATDVHVGMEYLVIGQKYTTAFRAGYYYQNRNRFFLASAANHDIDAFLRPIFGSSPGSGISHFTAGTGITVSNFQVDAAIDLGQKNDVNQGTKQEITDATVNFILSGVYRF